ncbi:hypothetical protein HRI_002522100 [Hibiscus trionum]|uniref:RWP-RK domain-containing protein n=1 Tax=Hibiscus trionum TaxID=183268 RepID=A0A9W7I3W7_HIBTR|nr:hypothetical protein HRI_002522100 [Hibiscus trionum]
MADPNADPFYNTPYSDYFMNIINHLNPQFIQENNDASGIGSSQALDLYDFQIDPDFQFSSLNPFWFNGETSTQNETNLGNEIQEPVSLPLPSNATIGSGNLQYAPLNPFGINGETSNQVETNFGNEIPGPVSLPLPSDGAIDVGNLLVDLVPENSHIDPSMINWLLSNQSESNLGNEIQEPFSFPYLLPPIAEETGGAFGDLQGTTMAGFICNESNGETSNPTRTDLVPSLQAQFGCHCCEILREIVHIKGTVVTKLQIHGRLVGVFFHAVLDVQQNSEAVSHQMFDFYEKSFEEVKQFLTQYCMKRKQEKYTMVKDPNSSFFEALCVGFDWYENLANGADPAANNGRNQGKLPMSGEEQGVTACNEAAKPKNLISLTEQRRKVKATTIKDLANYFHLTRKKAAQKLGISETVVHNIWLEGNRGVKRRWPFRKIHSKVKEIVKLKELLKSEDPHVRDRARDDIRKKEAELAKYYEGV